MNPFNLFNIFQGSGKSQLIRLAIAVVGVLAFTYISRCNKDKGFNIYKIEDDIKLGSNLSQQISANPTQYPILDPQKYINAYKHLNRITNNILNSGKVANKNKFVWQVRIIKDDKTLNAFCAPGGYIYVYTGIIKYLDTESQLAGVLGHEIAHADLRHSSEKLTQQYGTELILALLLGGNSDYQNRQIAQIAGQLNSLAYSRDNEAEADLASVDYLCGTQYDAAGVAGFFEKMVRENKGGRQPAFLSTHPNPENRVKKIHEYREKKGCSPKLKPTGKDNFDAQYQDFKNSLP